MRQRSGFTTVLLAVAVLGGTAEAYCQEGPFGFQIRGGFTRPLAGFRDPAQGWEGEARSGSSLAMGFTFPLFRVFGGYLGFSEHRFGCDEAVCPRGKPWVATGFDVALRSVIGRGRLRGWIQGGIHTHRMEGRLRGNPNPVTSRSDDSGGYEVGAGVLIQVGERTSLAPGVRYGLGNVPFEGRSTLGLRYMVFDIGLMLGF